MRGRTGPRTAERAKLPGNLPYVSRSVEITRNTAGKFGKFRHFLIYVMLT